MAERFALVIGLHLTRHCRLGGPPFQRWGTRTVFEFASPTSEGAVGLVPDEAREKAVKIENEEST